MGIIKGYHHAAVICSDYDVSRRFYSETLGLRVIAETWREKRRSWKCDLEIPGGGLLELFSFPEAPARPSRPEALGLRHLAFEVDNLDQAVKHLRGHGVDVEEIRRDETRGGKRYTFFADPDGLPLELCEK